MMNEEEEAVSSLLARLGNIKYCFQYKNEEKEFADFKTKDGSTLLHYIAKYGLVEHCRKMIEDILPMGLLDIDDVNDNGETCLHWAAKNCNFEVVVMLLDAGINIDDHNIDSYQPFDDVNQGRDCRTLILDEIKKRSSVRYLHHDDVHICGGKLHMAIGWSEETYKKLIDSGYDLEKRNCYGASSLHLAAFLSMNDVVEYLVKIGADVHSKDYKGNNVLHYCALAYEYYPKYSNRDIEKCIKIFLNAGVDLNQVNDYGATALALSIYYESRLLLFLDYDADVNIKDVDGKSILEISAYDSRSDAVRWILEYGGIIEDSLIPGLKEMPKIHDSECLQDCLKQISERHEMREKYKEMKELTCLEIGKISDNLVLKQVLSQLDPLYVKELRCSDDGSTPLHICALNCNYHCIDLLCDSGVDVNALSSDGRSALHVAASSAGPEFVRKLLLRGAHINLCDNDGHTPLSLASRRAMEVLCSFGAELEVKDKMDRTALYWAVHYGDFDCVAFLLSKGALVTTAVLEVAVMKDHASCLQLLVDTEGVDFKIWRSVQGHSLLHRSAATGHVRCLNVLISKGCNIDEYITGTYLTALHLSSWFDHLSCTSTLLKAGARIQQGIENYTDEENMPNSCSLKIVEELENRNMRIEFNAFINRFIEYKPYRDIIYYRCNYGNSKKSVPYNGWDFAFALRDKYYFDEIFFYLHLHVAKVLNMKAKMIITRSSIKKSTSNRSQLVMNSNTASTLMTVLTDKLKLLLKPTYE